MIKNFLFVLNRFKTSSVLNILGLSVAFAVFSITMIQAHYDFNYNRNFKQFKDIYQYSNYWKTFDGQMIGISIPLAQLMANQFPEIKAYSVLDTNEEKFKLQDDPFSSFKFFLSKANEGFLDVFTPKILSGDARQAFTEQNKVMLTDDVAQLLFGNENPIGQVIVQDTTRYTVVAVCDRFPENCDLKNGVYTTVLGVEDFDKMGWFNYHGYFVVDAKDILSLQEKLNQPGLLGEDDSIDRIELVPLPDIYFTPVEGKEDVDRGSLRTTISLMAIGILILLIAFINFMNFSVAMIPSRVRGVNIQKILGVNPQRLKYIIALEAVCFAFLSFLISLLLISLFKNTDLNSFFSADLSLEKNIPLLVFIALTGILLGILFGIYPSRRVTSYQPAMALSGSFAQSKRSSFLRNVLITLQFFFAITLIVVAFFIKIQHDYMINRSDNHFAHGERAKLQGGAGKPHQSN